MKKQLLLAALFFTAVSTTAQTTLYSQDFEGPLQEIFDEGWTFLKTEGPTENFGVFISVPEIQDIGFSGKTIGATTYNTVNFTAVHVANTDIMILSPFIELPMADVVLSYRVGSMAIEDQSSSHYSVYILTEDDLTNLSSPSDFSTLLDSRTAEESATASGESFTTSYNLPTYAGEKIRIVFRLHDSPTNAALLFDDILLTHGELGNGDALPNDMFSVYPNPVKNLITINGNNSVAFESIAIIDMNGHTLATKQLDGANNGQIDISGLSSGMYIVQLSSDHGNATRKIIKR